MSFPPSKTFKELGLDPNATFRVAATYGNGLFDKENLLKFIEGEDLEAPKFRRLSDGFIAHAFLHCLEYADEPKTLYNLRRGDLVFSTEGWLQVVLEVYPSGTSYLLSESWKGDFSEEDKERSKIYTGGSFTAKELEARGFKPVPSTPEPEPTLMTLAEIEKALGKRIKIVE